MSPDTDRVTAALANEYAIERELGVWSVATVYLARDVRHRRKVAVKVIRSDLTSTLAGDRFLREIEIASQLQHPHVLTLIDSGEADGFLYYVMPYVEGEPVRNRLGRGEEIPVSDVLDVLSDVTQALQHAHELGIAHLDMRPENILVSADSAVVTDFGLALAVSAADAGDAEAERIAQGNPLYMAPEQFDRDMDVDHRADLYALGCIAYELLTGRPPFEGRNPEAIFAAKRKGPPEHVKTVREAVPTAFGNIVMKCLARDPNDRYQSAEDLLVRLQALRSSSGALIVTSEHKVRPAPSKNRRVVVGALGGIATLAVAAAVWVLAGLGTPGGSGADGAARSLAVLPFADLSPDQDQQHLGDGIAETLIASLSRIDGLQVAARTSAFSFKGRNEDVREIGQQLGVDAVLEGTVQRSGNRLRITAQLVNTEDGFQVWSETFDRNVDDVFAVQDEVTRAVVRALRVELIGEAARPAERGPTENIDAYNAYLLGRYHWNDRTADRQAVATAAANFHRAVELDSGYAQAWSGLAETYVLYPQYLPGILSQREAGARAERAARQAIALDSTLAEPFAALGTLYQSQGRYDDARAAFERSVALDPGYATGHFWYATYLLVVGETALAVAQMRQAALLDPLSQIIAVWLALALDADGQREAAGEQYAKALVLDANSWRVHRDAWVHYLRRADFEQAGVHFGRFLALAGEPEATVERWRDRVTNPETRSAALRTAADSIFPAVVAASPAAVPWGMTPLRAEVLGLIGQKDRALELLEWEYGLAGGDPLPLKVYVLSDDLRNDPRFAALLMRLGLGQ